MPKQEPHELLQKVVNETSGTALTLSPKEDKWTGYLLQQKQNFEAPTLPELCQKIADTVIEKRTLAEATKEGKKKSKPFKYTA